MDAVLYKVVHSSYVLVNSRDSYLSYSFLRVNSAFVSSHLINVSDGWSHGVAARKAVIVVKVIWIFEALQVSCLESYHLCFCRFRWFPIIASDYYKLKHQSWRLIKHAFVILNPIIVPPAGIISSIETEKYEASFLLLLFYTFSNYHARPQYHFLLVKPEKCHARFYLFTCFQLFHLTVIILSAMLRKCHYYSCFGSLVLGAIIFRRPIPFQSWRWMQGKRVQNISVL